MGCICSAADNVAEGNELQQVRVVGVSCVICGDCPCPFGHSRAHSLCTDCFKNMIIAWCDKVSGGCSRPPTTLAAIGQLRCPAVGCNSFYTTDEVSFKLLGGKETATAEQYRRGVQHQRELFFQRRMNEGEAPPPVMIRERSEREIFVEEELLTLHCPNCRTTFAEFEGCFAVECRVCRSWFCAWCVNFFGTNQQAHAHVAVCPDNQHADKNVWGTLQQFNDHHNRRRSLVVNNFLAKENDDSLNRRLAPVLGDIAPECVRQAVRRRAASQGHEHHVQRRIVAPAPVDEAPAPIQRRRMSRPAVDPLANRRPVRRVIVSPPKRRGYPILQRNPAHGWNRF